MSSGTFFSDYVFECANDNLIISTSSIEEVPSNKNDLINLNINGILKPSDRVYVFNITFPKTSPGPSSNK